MTWFKVNDQFFAHPKVIDLSKDAKLLYLAGLAYCHEHLTDGQISTAALRMVAATVDVPNGTTVAALTDAGLWEAVAGGYHVHDYLDHQESAATTKRKRDEARERMRHARNENGDECSQDVRANISSSSREVHENKNGTAREVPTLEVEVDIEEDVEEETEAEGHEARAPDGASVPDPVDWVWDYYKTEIQPEARVCPREKIRARLKRFTVDELTVGIEHFAADRWWMDHNSTRGGGWFFHSDARSEQFLTMEPRDAPQAMRKDGVFG